MSELRHVESSLEAPRIAPPVTEAVVDRLAVFPLKSGTGMEVKAAHVGRFGLVPLAAVEAGVPEWLAGDRSWAVTHENRRGVEVPLTMREEPALGQVRAEIRTDGAPSLVLTATEELLREAVARGHRDVTSELRLSLDPRLADQRRQRQVAVFGDGARARDASGEGAAWFATVLGRGDIRLVHVDPEPQRLTSEEWGDQQEIGLADGFPLHGVTAEALDDLGHRLLQRADAEAQAGDARDNLLSHWGVRGGRFAPERFRHNLQYRAAGSAPFPHYDDAWLGGVLSVGDIEVDVPKPSARCPIPTTDPETGRRTHLLQLLRTYRRGDAAAETLRGAAARTFTKAGAVYYGVNLSPRSPGVMRVGDPIRWQGAA